MAPDRGDNAVDDENDNDFGDAAFRSVTHEPIGQEPSAAFLAKQSEQRQFTVRAVLVGCVIGVVIAFSNVYFGLQTGWISGMSMPSALIGFAYFKGLRALTHRLSLEKLGLGDGFSEVENVLVQTVAGSLGSMPLGCGFVGVLPALEYLLRPSETPEGTGMAHTDGGLRLPFGKSVLWALGLCFFGVMFAVPLRKEVIIREKLRFPSGTATALMIGLLHGGEKTGAEGNIEDIHSSQRKSRSSVDDEEHQRLMGDASPTAAQDSGHNSDDEDELQNVQSRESLSKRDWKKQIRLLIYSFMGSGAYTVISYFIPQLHSIPILGLYLSKTWLWNLNPSPAYVGQGIIMGPATTIHMFIGAVIGWGVLSPLAKLEGWASGKVEDWNNGSKGWIVWVSLAIMLADSIVNIGWLVLRPILYYSSVYGPAIMQQIRSDGLRRSISNLTHSSTRGYSPVNLHSDPALTKSRSKDSAFGDDEDQYDAPPDHLIGIKTTLISLAITLVFCIVAIQFSFNGIINVGLTILALIMAMFLSIMGVRAMGETDLNPVSGISKLTQLVFALVTPRGSKSAIVINLVAGAISEAGAQQAGDLMQDLKTGHLLGASPKAQFYGQLIGSGVGAVVSAAIYRLYTSVYKIPSGLFQVPTAFVWIFTARLVTGQGLPPHIAEFAIGAAILWSVFTALRIYGNSIRQPDGTKGAPWTAYVPGGIAVAVGMYNTPSFTLARTAGGLLGWWWTKWKGREETPMIVLASGLILGEGLVSIVNLGLASANVPHL